MYKFCLTHKYHSYLENIDYNLVGQGDVNFPKHWMWSTFYFKKKYKGFFVAFFEVLPKLISSIVKFLFFSLFNNKERKKIYFQRFSGLFNSIAGKQSWYRPKF